MIKNSKLIIILLLFLSIVSCLCVASGVIRREKYNKINENHEAHETAGNNDEQEIIQRQISKMTLDEKIGQMLMVGIEGYNYNDHTRNLEEKYKVGGFIALNENVKSTKQLLELLNAIKEGNSKNKIPLFLSIDEEGGRVNRLPSEVRNIPSAREIGKLNNENLCYELGSAVASEIKSFGFNMNLAPVLDVNTNPYNSVIGDRSYGADVNLVSRLGLQTIKGIQSQNVVSVAKHFPGHGDTSVDSHKGLPVVNNDLNRLKSVELVPFTSAINNSVDGVMAAHILLPKLDSVNPSSMSQAVITDLLRKNLKFNGIVLTDDMTMGAIVKHYDIGNAAVKSVAAGADIILVCHGYDNVVKVFNDIKASVLNGKISVDRLNESVYRILKLKQKRNIKDEIISDVNVNKINQSINEVLNK